MTVHIALLRAINVAGKNTVSMAGLRDLFAGLGFTNVQTLLQSGNVVFESEDESDAELERLLENETETRLGLRTDYLVRSAAEWQDIIAANPFPEKAKRDPGHLLLVALKKRPEAGDVEALRVAISGPERIAAAGRELYVVYPEGVGRSKLTNVLIEKKLGSRGTGRNWNTVLKLGDRAQP
jgi:uncharacterized protein (DUF1697 family)